MSTTHGNTVNAAVASGDWKAIVDAYIAAWKAGETVPITKDVLLTHLLQVGWRYRIASAAQEHSAARETLAPHFDALTRWLGQGEVADILAYSAQPDPLGGRWRRVRRTVDAQGRGAYVEAAVRALCHVSGREAARRQASQWWADCELEEEREGVLTGLVRGAALTREIIGQLGPDAIALTDTLIARGRIKANNIGDTSGTQALPMRTDRAVVSRLNDLLTLVNIRLNARDARFPAYRRSPVRHRLFRDAIDKLRYRNPEFLDLAQALDVAIPDVQTLSADPDVYVFPLMRLLHLRMILEQPELGGALRAPDRFVSPEVMLYVLGRDAATYVPEIRVAGGTDRRWRAIWAESTAEAMSALVLEDRVALKLVTLARIPEDKKPTPDFRALTTARQRVVYECKGATDLETHKRQKRRARVQLGKDKASESTWGSSNHAYACCFFAAREGTSASSCFSVEDPPFLFDEYFGEGADLNAIRRHFAAVLAAAGLRAAAGVALTGNAAREEEHELFYVGGVTEEREAVSEGVARAVPFAGTYRDLEKIANDLRHPNPQTFTGMRMFTGIHAPALAVLARGTLPTWALDTSEGEAAADFQRLPVVGTTTRGVYSVLSDGAFLAFEVS